ncbi:MAG: response regulator [Candidatus Saganbacteria bacterium]|nr:response regulator [Candidatus Saganbacteria bacterium]
MVVDDETDVADVIAETIKDTNRYEALVAYSAREALDHLSENRILRGLFGNRIRLIVLDIIMPEMGGLEFLELVRKDYDGSIGVVILTAYEDEDKWTRATSALVVDYIKKPFKNEKLISIIDRFCQGQRETMIIETLEKHIEKREGLAKDAQDP